MTIQTLYFTVMWWTNARVSDVLAIVEHWFYLHACYYGAACYVSNGPKAAFEWLDKNCPKKESSTE